MAKFRLVVLISGRGSNLRAIIEDAQRLGPACPYEICAVISNKKDAAGLAFAQSMGISTAVVEREKGTKTAKEFNSDLTQKVLEYGPDLIVLAGFMQVLGRRFIERFANKIVNIHPSLLPAFKGLDVHQRALDAGVKFSGCTVHYVTLEIDSGPILGQAVVPVLPQDTAERLASRILRQEHRLYPRILEALARAGASAKERATTQNQDHSLFLCDEDASLISCI